MHQRYILIFSRRFIKEASQQCALLLPWVRGWGGGEEKITYIHKDFWVADITISKGPISYIKIPSS